MFIFLKSMSDMKLGHIGSKTRSLGQILEKPWAQLKFNLHETLPECLSQLNLGQEQNWVMSGQTLGHKVKSLEGTVLIQSS